MRLVTLSLLLPVFCFGQSWAWVIKSHGESTVSAGHLATDPAGNSFVILYCPASFSLADAAVDSGCHLFRVSSSGVVSWSKKLSFNATLMTTDRSGNIYLAGHFDSLLATGNYRLETDHKEFFLLKVDPKGNEKWVVRGDGPTGKIAVATDPLENVYVGGSDVYAGVSQDTTRFNNAIHFEDSASLIFLAKINASGKTEWLKRKIQKDSLNASTILNMNADAYGRLTLLAQGKSCALCFTDYLVQLDEWGQIKQYRIIGDVFNPQYYFDSARDMVSNGSVFAVSYNGYRYDAGKVKFYTWDRRNEWTFDLGGTTGCMLYRSHLVDAQGNFQIAGVYLPRDGYCGGTRPSYDVFIQEHDPVTRTYTEKVTQGKGEEFFHAMAADAYSNMYVGGSFNQHRMESYGLLNQEVIFDTYRIKAETGTPQFFLAKLGTAAPPLPAPAAAPAPEEAVYEEKGDGFWFYPNPVTATSKVYAGMDGVLLVHDVHGKLMGRWQITHGTSDVRFSDWPAGIYSAKFTCELGVKTRKLIVK